MANSANTETDVQRRARLREEAVDIVAQRIVNGHKVTRFLYRVFSFAPLCVSAFFLWIVVGSDTPWEPQASVVAFLLIAAPAVVSAFLFRLSFKS